MYPSRKQALELRIQDLKSRLEEIAEYTDEESAWLATDFYGLAFSRIELLSIDPQDFYSVREITRAINMAEDELAAIGDE